MACSSFQKLAESKSSVEAEEFEVAIGVFLGGAKDKKNEILVSTHSGESEGGPKCLLRI